MKIATLVSRHGLTLPQYHALAAARRQALTQTATSWRNRDGARAQPGTVRRLADQSLLAIDGATASITAAGRVLLAELEGGR